MLYTIGNESIKKTRVTKENIYVYNIYISTFVTELPSTILEEPR